jgi:hypothetical protein
LRDSIKGTNKLRCYNVYIKSVYYELVMTLTRMYDQRNEPGDVCFKRLFELLSDDFIKELETQTTKQIKAKIKSAFNDYKYLNGSHYLSRLRIIRHKRFAHTSFNFDKRQLPKYGDAERLLHKTLLMLNKIDTAVRDNTIDYEEYGLFWNSYAVEFWGVFNKTNTE